ncbi:hypothetical protein NPIL_568421 [Nephila pilipes]|uniref:Uncharacterized protein n=1 Tax=Nephila pilipes TaxID=299642 RepID=A0A8X6UIL3_NEPPI|nr:hypothetical protein NPIL_568421 [Nephila pilipes]
MMSHMKSNAFAKVAISIPEDADVFSNLQDFRHPSTAQPSRILPSTWITRISDNTLKRCIHARSFLPDMRDYLRKSWNPVGLMPSIRNSGREEGSAVISFGKNDGIAQLYCTCSCLLGGCGPQSLDRLALVKTHWIR